MIALNKIVFLGSIILIVIGCGEYAEKDHSINKDSLNNQSVVKNEPSKDTNIIFSIDQKFSMRIFITCDVCSKWTDREKDKRQFICVEVKTTDGSSFEPTIGARENNITFFDNSYWVSEICYQPGNNSKSALKILFAFDAFNKFKNNVDFTFSYGPTPYMKFNDYEINALVNSFDRSPINNDIALADSAWLTSKGLGDFLVKKH